MTTPAPKRRLSPETERICDEVSSVFAKAVAAAREENRRLGVPNFQVDDQGRLTEELPDGTVNVVLPVSKKPDSQAQ
jgi:hypothetical protein